MSRDIRSEANPLRLLLLHSRWSTKTGGKWFLHLFIHSTNIHRPSSQGGALSCRLQMFIKESLWDHHLWKGTDGSWGSCCKAVSTRIPGPQGDEEPEGPAEVPQVEVREPGHHTLRPTVTDMGHPEKGGWTWPWLPLQPRHTVLTAEGYWRYHSQSLGQQVPLWKRVWVHLHVHHIFSIKDKEWQ